MVFLVGRERERERERESLVSLLFSQSVCLPSCFSSSPFSQFLSAACLASVLPNSCLFESLQNLRKKTVCDFWAFFFFFPGEKLPDLLRRRRRRSSSSSNGVCGSVGGDRCVGKSSQHEEVVSLGLPELGTGSRQRVRQEFRAVDERRRRRWGSAQVGSAGEAPHLRPPAQGSHAEGAGQQNRARGSGRAHLWVRGAAADHRQTSASHGRGQWEVLAEAPQ